MNSTVLQTRRAVTAKTVLTIVSVLAAVALPQLFHAIGVLSGTGAATGAAFLPMHIPVLLAGFVGGPVVGILAGLFSPIVSFAISGMPTAALLPFMVLELGVYGFVAGLLSKRALNPFVKLLIVQIAGRLARAAAIVFAIAVLDNPKLTYASIGSFITAGLFGIVLQWALIPLVSGKMKEFYERHA